LNPNTINNMIGKRRYSFDDNILNKRKNVGQYPLNPSTKRNSDFDININSKKQNVGQYQFNPSTKRSLDDENIDMLKNKKIKENEVHNNLPVKRPGNNIDNENNKRIEISNNTSEIANITLNVPSSFHEEITGKNKEERLNAINDELNNLYSNKIMTYVSKLPEDKNPIKTKWIFSIKKDSNNIITRFKARSVAKGFSQIRGIDYELTFSPTLSIDSMKFIISLAAKFHWNIFQLDIKAAYLNAKLDKDIFVNIPQGDKNYGKGYWKLNKALYGLKQSGRVWNGTITIFLENIGFQQLVSEPCILRTQIFQTGIR